MEVNLTPDTEKKLRDFAEQSGRGTDDLVEDAVSGYFDEVQQTRLHIEHGFAQAERGELTDGETARCEIQDMKSAWRLQRGHSE